LALVPVAAKLSFPQQAQTSLGVHRSLRNRANFNEMRTNRVAVTIDWPPLESIVWPQS
jgi:hypothetical protein